MFTGSKYFGHYPPALEAFCFVSLRLANFSNIIFMLLCPPGEEK